MAQVIEAEGIPASALLLEERSTDTISNIGNACALYPDLREVVLVTDVYHGPRARVIAWHLGLRARSSCPAYPAELGRARLLRAGLREAAAMLKIGIWMATGHRLR